MILGNKNLISTIQSRVVTKEEFDYDHLYARPLYSMLTQDDINQLYTIAHSVRYAGKGPLKLKKIDEIMHMRGFKKLSAGTNRVCYSYFEDPTIVVKVAFDDVGRHDNPKEFLNQVKLKPFCAKCFEVSPDGTVGVFERVEAIENIEEFISISDRVLKLLNIITSRYIMADIGASTFMNFGLRNGFGPVLIDYPYLYEPDIQKLVCKAPNLNSPTGICGGFIDYDDGFDKLICTKCGAEYKAAELGRSLYTKSDSTIVRKGRNKMILNFRYNGVQIAGGENNNTDEFENKITSTIVNNPHLPVYQNGVMVDNKSSLGINIPSTTNTKHIKPIIKKVNVPKKDEEKSNAPKVKYSPTKNTGVNNVNNTPEKKKFAAINPNNTASKIKLKNASNAPSANNQVKLTAIRFDELPNVTFNFDELEGEKMKFSAPFSSNNILKVNILVNNIPEDVRRFIAPPVDNSELNEIKARYEQAKTDIYNLENTVDKLKAKAASAIQQKTEAQEALVSDRLQNGNKSKDFQSEINSLKLENDKKSSRIKELELKVAELEASAASIEELKYDNQIFVEENETLQKKYNELKEKYDSIKDLPDSLKEYTEEKKELTKKLAVQEGIISNLQEISSNYNTLADKLQVSDDELNKSRDEILEKEKVISGLTIQVKNLQLDLQNKDKEINKIEEEKMDIEINNEDLSKQVLDLTKQIENMSVNAEETESDDDHDVYQGFNFINGTLKYVNQIAESIGKEDPTQNRSDRVIAFLNEQGEYYCDTDDNILVVESLNTIPLDNISFKKKEKEKVEAKK